VVGPPPGISACRRRAPRPSRAQASRPLSEHDGVVDRASLSSAVCICSISPDSTIRKKPSRLRDQHREPRLDLLGEVRLLGEFLHRAPLRYLRSSAPSMLPDEQPRRLSAALSGRRSSPSGGRNRVATSGNLANSRCVPCAAAVCAIRPETRRAAAISSRAFAGKELSTISS